MHRYFQPIRWVDHTHRALKELVFVAHFSGRLSQEPHSSFEVFIADLTPISDIFRHGTNVFAELFLSLCSEFSSSLIKRDISRWAGSKPSRKLVFKLGRRPITCERESIGITWNSQSLTLVFRRYVSNDRLPNRDPWRKLPPSQRTASSAWKADSAVTTASPKDSGER